MENCFCCVLVVWPPVSEKHFFTLILNSNQAFHSGFRMLIPGLSASLSCFSPPTSAWWGLWWDCMAHSTCILKIVHGISNVDVETKHGFSPVCWNLLVWHNQTHNSLHECISSACGSGVESIHTVVCRNTGRSQLWILWGGFQAILGGLLCCLHHMLRASDWQNCFCTQLGRHSTDVCWPCPLKWNVSQTNSQFWTRNCCARLGICRKHYIM